MLAQEVAHKYANALLLSTRDKNLVDKAYQQFNELRDYLASDPSLLKFLGAPQILEEAKMSVVREVFSGRLEPLFVEFLVVLIDKRRINHLPQIIDEFNDLVETEKGICRATVVTATTLDEAQRKVLTEKLARKTGLEIILEEKIDPSILGGMIVAMDNEVIDGSVLRGLNRVRDQLRKVRVH
ncbi:MAG: ATP synthase F1 subunit delta [candidate division Zixibacteria bacterium]|nr:ATP synthase F1 subunit delta [candidate division Zixibacteria bacterium]